MNLDNSFTCHKLSHFVVSMALLIILITACENDNTDKIIIATAANAQYAIKEIAENFKKETGHDYALIISSSGKHTAQIEAGVPYDVFISADLKFPETLFEKNLTTNAPKVYAYGKLVLWSMYDRIDLSVGGLSVGSQEHIAMPNAKTAPYGRAAKEFLKRNNLFDTLRSKLVFASSVAQTNQFILSKTAELGFTAASTVMAPDMEGIGHWLAVEDSQYSPITQAAVILKSSSHPIISQQFYNYLYSQKAKEVLVKYGYSLNDSTL